jgi:aryl carrier-like protein
MALRELGPPPTTAELRAAVANILRTDPAALAEDANLLDLGLDSLGMMRVINLWRRAGIRMSLDDLTAEPTLAAWSRLTRHTNAS